MTMTAGSELGAGVMDKGSNRRANRGLAALAVVGLVADVSVEHWGGQTVGIGTFPCS